MIFDDYSLILKPSAHVLYHENPFTGVLLYCRITHLKRWQHDFQGFVFVYVFQSESPTDPLSCV